MGISPLQSYRGAQVFEALGLRQDVIDEYFTWTSSRVGGIGIDVIAQEVLHAPPAAFSERQRERRSAAGRAASTSGAPTASTTCSTRRASTGCRSRCAPATTTCTRVRRADRTTRRRSLRRCAACSSSSPGDADPARRSRAGREHHASASRPAPCRYGSISKEAHETLAIAMNRIGGKSNTGEGGEDPERYVPHAERRLEELAPSSRWPRAASASPATTWSTRRSCRSRWRRAPSPAKAASCPARKVYPWIAKTRHTTAGVGLISPPPHHDIYSIEDLAELIHDLKNANRDARISVKLVAEVGVGTIAAGVAKAHADVVLISGHDGGTGASPQTGDQARRPALGTRPRRDAPDAGHQQPAQPHRRRDRRPAEDRAATWPSPRCSAPRNSASPRRRWWRWAAS